MGTARASTSLTAADRAARARASSPSAGPRRRRPLVGLHPSGGRPVKQWDVGRWARGRARACSASSARPSLITGSAADAPLAEAVARGLARRRLDLTGRLVAARDAGRDRRASTCSSRRTPGPMHMACAVGTPSVSVFGPSDPVRYFSGGNGRAGHAPRGGAPELWCAPCNLIRKPPAECARARRSRVPAPRDRRRRVTPPPPVCCSPAASPPRGGRSVKTLVLVAGRAVPPRDRRRPRCVAWDEAAEQALRARRRRGAHGRPDPGGGSRGGGRRGGDAPGRRTGAAARCSTAAASASCFDWKGVSLWWFAELYLHHSTAATALRALDRDRPPRCSTREAPDEVEAHGLAAEEAAAARADAARRAACSSTARRAPPPRRSRRRALRRRAAAGTRSRRCGDRAQGGARPGPRPRRRPGAPRGALPLPRRLLAGPARAEHGRAPRAYEHYFDRLIPGVGEDARRCGRSWWRWDRARPSAAAALARAARATGCACTADGEAATSTSTATSPARRRARDARRATRADAARPGASCAGSPALREAFSHRGVRFADLARGRPRGHAAAAAPVGGPLATRRWRAALRARCGRRSSCLYAESSGWGRAALAACRAAGVPAVAIQHGILYPNVLLVPPRPRRGGLPAPRPHRGVRRGGAALPGRARATTRPRRWWSPAAPSSTSCWRPRARWDRRRARRRLGVARGRAPGGGGQPLPRHPRHAPVDRQRASRAAARAARRCRRPRRGQAASGRGRRGLRSASALRATGATRARSSPPAPTSLELLHAADALVTVESLSAVEALVLGRPVVVLNMPTNLREMVEAGVALGVAAGGGSQRARCAAPSSTTEYARRPCAPRARATSPSGRRASTAGPPRASSTLMRSTTACPWPRRRPRERMVGSRTP